LATIKDKWIYFLKNCGVLEEVPTEMNEVPQIKKAFEIANVNLNFQESDILQKQEFFVQDMQSLVKEAIEEGREEGRQEGQVKLIIRLLSRRLGQINLDIESHLTELSIDKLENLAEAVLDFSNTEDLTAWLEANSQ
jgi:flagellar biosynthesis/type III secretory pathway protein FliH